MDTPKYTVQASPGKGKCLVARMDIAAGERIILEKPLFTATTPIGSLDDVLLAKVVKLSKDQLRQYLSLHNAHANLKPFTGIFKTNALPCGSSSPVGAVYPTICLINHSCISNAHNNWNDDAQHETIHATRDIKTGEEICISYTAGEPSGQRIAKLKASFGFDCACVLCSSPAKQVQESDARRLIIERLDDAIGNPSRTMNSPDQAIADCQKMLQLLKEEYGLDASGPLEARLYYDAFQISVIHSDQARASVFAERGYTARVSCEGEDSPETKRMKSLMQNPTQHQSFGVSKRWRTTKGVVPKGLGHGEFEDWLWRRGKK